jgi:signal transduction histidine kinase
MASQKMKTEELSHLSRMILDISDKIREVIWTTNVENDNLENLLYYIQFNMERLFEHSIIAFRSEIPDDVVEMNVESQCRRNIYLIVKELGHNAIKHSKASQLTLTISVEDDMLVIVVKDNGIGFNSQNPEKAGMGLENIRLRIINLKGSFAIENYKGTVAIIRIPLSELSNNALKYRPNLWRSFTFDLYKYSLRSR